jgi:hypothetical protein
VSRYKSYKDALVLGSKANSTAGCTLQQIAANNTSLLIMQQKRCPNFDVFEAVFSNTPNVKPVSPIEIGADGDDDDDGEEGCREAAAVVTTRPPPPPPPAAPAAAAAAAAPAAAAAAGKAPAPFHLAPSKKEKKMDLGEAYLKAQQSRMESVAASATQKNRTDLIIALTLQGKTAVEIADFLNVVVWV